jgi:GGDEF domain-containing protein
VGGGVGIGAEPAGVRDEDTVARLGGDEFAILLEQAPSHEVAVRVAGRILEAMQPPFRLQGRQVQVGPASA